VATVGNPTNSQQECRQDAPFPPTTFANILFKFRTRAVHIFNIKRLRPIVRPTILTAFLGYVLVCIALMYDLGRPYRIWHPLIMRNPHSVMFEVAYCVMLYTTVLSLEFSPIVLERLNLQKPLKIVRAALIGHSGSDSVDVAPILAGNAVSDHAGETTSFLPVRDESQHHQYRRQVKTLRAGPHFLSRQQQQWRHQAQQNLQPEQIHFVARLQRQAEYPAVQQIFKA
jgi:hypothetical protein